MSAVAAATLGAGFLSAAGSVYSNAVNSAAQIAINNKNAAVQYAINADQIEAARMNNETAINLANTAHQREVQDLRDANLNPILSAHGNGSAVPALDTPGLEAPQAVAPSIENPLSGLASNLASAVQVNDAHALNDARLTLMGIPQDSDERKFLNKTLSARTIAQAQSALEVARSEEERAKGERMSAQLENIVKSRFLGLGISENGRSVSIPDPNVLNLIRDGFMSDLRSRANKNLRETLNSAKGVSDAVRSWFPASLKRVH